MIRRPPSSTRTDTLFPYTTLFRSHDVGRSGTRAGTRAIHAIIIGGNPMTKLDLDWPHNFNEIPKEVFVRKDVYDTELQRIFHGEEWHPVCHESEIPERGDFKTFRLASIPLIIARGVDCLEIGSASCRERVFNSMIISVFAVYL